MVFQWFYKSVLAMNGKRRTCRTCRWAWGHFWHVKATLRCYGSTLRGQCWHTKITLGYCRSILKFVRPKRDPTWSFIQAPVWKFMEEQLKIYLLQSCPWRGNRFARATLAYARAQELVEASVENLLKSNWKHIPFIKLSVARKPLRSSDTRYRSCSGVGRSIM